MTNSGIKTFVSRIEVLEAEKRDLAADIKDIYAEAKSAGYNTKALRKVIAERRIDAAKRQELEETMDQYRHALGMLAGTPLGNAAVTVQFGTEPDAAA